jgi:microcystin-dependent protein
MPITINGSGSVQGISAGGLPSGTVTSDTLASSAIYLTSPAGAVCFVAQNSAPTGWLKANGAAISRTAYANLFAAIGTTFGIGDGSTTFQLPDLRGQFLRSWADDAATYDSGRVLGSTQADDFKSHTHPYQPSYHLGNSGGAFNGNALIGSASSGGLSTQAAIPSQSTSATGGTETRPRNIALLACIKF